ncbi:type II secretion system F family protein [Clavibacter sp. MX14-G9D]|uniref:type II secretion system F family protein n=1 Tax=Clavibacter sp. MX14-G9D TaxID=3064656 RepID=UPI00293F370E|nr:type II secretion system F family protein [Clavibacter sp. MX14-G9D]
MIAAEPWGALLGLVAGMGAWTMMGAVPRFRRARLLDRVAPHVLDVSEGARRHLALTTVHPLPVLGTLGAPAVVPVRRALARVLGGTERIERLLGQSGSEEDVERHRSRQLVALVLGTSTGVLVVALVGGAALTSGSLPPAQLVAVPVVAAVTGLVACDSALDRRARRRVARISAELPTVLEFLALSLAAGEGLLDALRRVARVGSGELAGELGRVVADVGTGIAVARAFEDLARRLALPPVSRLVDQLAGSLERGTPLAEVLRAQAQDVREVAKRDLLESAGRKEVAMLVPLVFLILPLTILFALFPGVLVLQLGL